MFIFPKFYCLASFSALFQGKNFVLRNKKTYNPLRMKKIILRGLLVLTLLLGVGHSSVLAGDLLPVSEEKARELTQFLQNNNAIKTVSMLPLEITLSGTSSRLISGNVTGVQVRGNPSEVVFSLRDKEGTQWWENTIQWKNGYNKNGKVNIPFRFFIDGVSLAGNYDLVVQILDIRGEPIAQGAKEVPFVRTRFSTDNGAMEKLTVQENAEYINVGFSFTNGERERELRPVIRMFERDMNGDVIYENTKDPVLLAPEDKGSFFFDVPRPQFGGVYVFQVSMESAGGVKASGVLSQRYVIEKDFAIIQSINIEPGRYMFEDETLTIDIAGRTTRIDGDLRMEVIVKQMGEEKEVIKEFIKRVPLTEFDGAYFIVPTIKFDLAKPANMFDVSVRVFYNDLLIGEKTKKTEYFASPIKELEQEDERVLSGVINLFAEKEYIVIGIIVLILLLVGFGIWGYKKSHRVLILLFLPLLFFSFRVLAQQQASTFGLVWVTTYPTQYSAFEIVPDGEFPSEFPPYDPNPERAELGFGNMYFRGSVYDENFLNTEIDPNPTQVYIAGQDAGGDPVFGALNMADFNIFDGSFFISGDESYDFNVNVASMAALGANDGIIYQVIFDHPTYGLMYHDIRQAVFDDGAPAVPTFVFKDTLDVTLDPNTDFTNGPITVEYTCTDGESECLLPEGSFVVAGNFCSNNTICESGTRFFETCDAIGNCRSTDPELVIDIYDPVAPVLSPTAFRLTLEGLTRNGNGSTTANRLRASSQLEIDFLSEDETEYTTEDHDDHACGKTDLPYTSPFTEKTTGTAFCRINVKNCLTDNGAIGAYDDSLPSPECEIACPEGTVPDLTRQFCIPVCDDKNFPMCLNTCLSNGLPGEPLFCPYSF